MKANTFRNMGAAVVLLGGMGTAGAVSADTCESFTTTFTNATNDELKVKKFEYKDGDNFKTENWFGLDGFQKIEHGKSIPFERNLTGIGGKTTQFRVTYQHRKGGTQWANERVELTDMFECNDGERKTVTLDR